MKAIATEIADLKRNVEGDRVLIVEDEPSTRRLLKTYLDSDGYEIQMVRSGEEALDCIAKRPPSVVVLDVMLPRLNGFEVCKTLKSSASTRFIPIILLTALRGNEERIQGIESGADDFISKPFSRVELQTRIKSLLRIKRLHDALEQKVEELEKAKSKLRRLAVTDGLTGLYNYRAFRSQLHLEASRSKRFKMPFALLMMDIDHFKSFNDQFGHPSGDLVLKTFARLLHQNVRDVDIASRYGGEEFILILPGTDKKSGLVIAEKIRKLVERTNFPMENPESTGSITISIGVAAYPQDHGEEEGLIKAVDKAMYKAKKRGRNRSAAA